jgi:hypothetical protein
MSWRKVPGQKYFKGQYDMRWKIPVPDPKAPGDGCVAFMTFNPK